MPEQHALLALHVGPGEERRDRWGFARYFQAVADIQALKEIPRNFQQEFRGVKGGSDGTRTRDLRRDRPAL
jgi:hypothetical protein